MPSGKAAGAFVALFLGAILAGSTVLDLVPLGINDIHSTCLDNIDQAEPDPGLDFGPQGADPSLNCLAFPFETGNGEAYTDPTKQTYAGGFSVTVWEVAWEYYVQQNGGDPCLLANFFAQGFHPDALATLDGSDATGAEYFNQNCLPPPPP